MKEVTVEHVNVALHDHNNVVCRVKGEVRVMDFTEYYKTYDAIMLANRSDMQFYRTHFHTPEDIAAAINRKYA